HGHKPGLRVHAGARRLIHQKRRGVDGVGSVAHAGHFGMIHSRHLSMVRLGKSGSDGKAKQRQLCETHDISLSLSSTTNSWVKTMGLDSQYGCAANARFGRWGLRLRCDIEWQKCRVNAGVGSVDCGYRNHRVNHGPEL